MQNTKTNTYTAAPDIKLFYACFVALITTSFGFAGDRATVINIRDTAKKDALRDIVIFPLIMLVSYILLILYFRSKGGYRAIVLKKESAPEHTYHNINR